LRAEWHDALLRAFAAHLDQPRAQLDVVDVDADQLTDAQSRGVEQLEPGAVADAERRREIRLLEEERDVRGLKDGRQVFLALRRGDAARRVRLRHSLA